jgi:hypothetical protein
MTIMIVLFKLFILFRDNDENALQKPQNDQNALVSIKMTKIPLHHQKKSIDLLNLQIILQKRY